MFPSVGRRTEICVDLKVLAVSVRYVLIEDNQPAIDKMMALL